MGHVTVLDQWGGAVWDNRLSLAGWSARQWWRRKGSEEDGWLLECQSEEQEVWHVRVDFNKVTDKRRSSVSSVKRGRYVGTRRFCVRGQRTPEVNKVALIALKYFNALIAATLIASINALTLTALVFFHAYICSCWYHLCYIYLIFVIRALRCKVGKMRTLWYVKQAESIMSLWTSQVRTTLCLFRFHLFFSLPRNIPVLLENLVNHIENIKPKTEQRFTGRKLVKANWESFRQQLHLTTSSFIVKRQSWRIHQWAPH